MDVGQVQGSIHQKAMQSASEPGVKAPSLTPAATPAALPETPGFIPASVTERSISSLVTAAALPDTPLSASIIAFARFFSLPLKPELLAALRQAVIRQSAGRSAELDKPDRAGKTGELPSLKALSLKTFALAAAAAAGKGAELSPKGLEAYAYAIAAADPEQDKQDKQGRHKRHKGQKKEEIPSTHLSAVELKKILPEAAEKDPLLAIMNRLPCKNGKHWIVLPFTVNDKGRSFKVTLRILAGAHGGGSEMADHLTLDIAEDDKRWLFVQKQRENTACDCAVGNLAVYLKPQPSAAFIKTFTQTLSRAVNIPEDLITVSGYTDTFAFETDYGNELLQDLLRTVNEAV